MSSKVSAMNPTLELAQRTFRALYPELAHEPLFGSAPAPEALPVSQSSSEHCTLCALHLGRTKPVEFRGSFNARVVFVGDFPSNEDDASGRPLSGEPGQLLDKMIAAMGLGPDDAFITTLTKCRPPRTHQPTEEEVRTCGQHLEAQLDRLPHAHWIVALGETAAQSVTASRGSIHHLRKERHEFRGRTVFATYHPRSVMADASLKRPTWDDLKAVMAAIKETP